MEDKKKNLATMSDKEFDDLLSKALDLIDKITPVSYSDDLESRVKEIKKDTENPVLNRALDMEDQANKAKEKTNKDAVLAKEKEADKYKRLGKLPGLEVFKSTLYRAIKDQVDAIEDDEDSWAALDRRHEDDPSILKKGIIKDDKEDENIPSVNVYFDQSGSWSNNEIVLGKKAINVINEFAERGEIKLNIYYTGATGVYTNATLARYDGGAEGFKYVVQHLRDTKAKNAIILSDVDLDSYDYSNVPTSKLVIDGCVWWLWKVRGPESYWIPNRPQKYLKGRAGNFQYSFEV